MVSVQLEMAAKSVCFLHVIGVGVGRLDFEITTYKGMLSVKSGQVIIPSSAFAI